MPGVAAKAILFAALLAAPGAGAPPASTALVRRPAAATAVPAARMLGDRALAEDTRGFIAGPERPRLVAAWWAALRDWSEAQFNAHDATRALPGAARQLDPDLEMQTLPLGGGAVLVSATRYGHGTAFILGPQGGRMRTLWTSAVPDPAARRAFPVLTSWSPDAIVGRGCGDEPCHAIGVNEIGALPAGPNGTPRFFVHGTYFSEIGMTMGGHLAIWEWDGRRARPLFARHFTFMAGQREPVLAVRGGELLLHVKDEFRHFYSCGSCEGRQLAWRLRMGPGGVRDLGRTSLTPELDFMDRLAGRLVRNEPVADIADAAPAAFFKRQVREAAGIEAPASARDQVLIGMLFQWHAAHTGNVTRLCFNADGAAGLFTIARRGAHLRLVAAREIGPGGCDRPAAHLQISARH